MIKKTAEIFYKKCSDNKVQGCTKKYGIQTKLKFHLLSLIL